MANLTEAAIWEPGIYQLEVTDPVMGGANGIDNLQAKQLAARTNFLNTAITNEATARIAADTAEIARANAAINTAVANEATARIAADTAEIARANNAYVKQGSGIGQTTNNVVIGWSAGSRLKATVDTTDIGNLVTETTGNSLYLPLGGNPAQVVSVAPATQAAHAVQFDQIRTRQSPWVTPLPDKGAFMSFAHGLGSPPKRYDIEVVCLVGEYGCVTGDILRPHTSAIGYVEPYCVGCNSTIVFAKNNTGYGFEICSLATGDAAVLSLSKWAYRFTFSKE